MAAKAESFPLGVARWLHALPVAAVAGWAALIVVTFAVQYTGLADRPAGFYLDESSSSYNAWRLVEGGVDEFGRPWPLFFEAFGDWRSWPHIYLLAGVFALIGPSIEAARFVSASVGVVTVLLCAWLAWRITRRTEVALLTGFTVLLMPWTFEPTRLAMEGVLMPALLAAFLLVLYANPPVKLSGPVVILLPTLLALLTYSYQLGRLLGPLLALGLVLYATRERWRGVFAVWLVYGVLLLPFVFYYLGRPDTATARFEMLSYLSRPLPEVVATFAHQFLGNLDPVRWLLTGDQNLRHHVWGVMGSMLFATLVLGIIGLDRAVHRVTYHPWSRYLAYGLLISLVPASLTLDLFHAHRLIAVPIFVVALAIGGQQWLLRRGRGERWRKDAFAMLALATLVQGAYFQLRYEQVAPHRGAWFDAAYPVLLEQALATGAETIYIKDVVVPGYIHAYWYGTVWGVQHERFVRLDRESRAPPGAVVLSSEEACPEPCEPLGEGGFFRLYRAQ